MRVQLVPESNRTNAHVFTHAPHPNGIDTEDLQEVRGAVGLAIDENAPLTVTFRDSTAASTTPAIPIWSMGPAL